MIDRADGVGHVAAWDVLDALKNPSKTSRTSQLPQKVIQQGNTWTRLNLSALPAMYFQTNQSAVRCMVVGRVPPSDDHGQPDFSQDPVYLLCGSYDASATLVDLRDSHHVCDILSTRCELIAVSRLESGRTGQTQATRNALLPDGQGLAWMQANGSSSRLCSRMGKSNE